jgi:hypothetical protein
MNVNIRIKIFVPKLWVDGSAYPNNKVLRVPKTVILRKHVNFGVWDLRFFQSKGQFS